MRVRWTVRAILRVAIRERPAAHVGPELEGASGGEHPGARGVGQVRGQLGHSGGHARAEAVPDREGGDQVHRAVEHAAGPNHAPVGSAPDRPYAVSAPIC